MGSEIRNDLQFRYHACINTGLSPPLESWLHMSLICIFLCVDGKGFAIVSLFDRYKQYLYAVLVGPLSKDLINLSTLAFVNTALRSGAVTLVYAFCLAIESSRIGLLKVEGMQFDKVANCANLCASIFPEIFEWPGDHFRGRAQIFLSGQKLAKFRFI